MSGRFNAVVLGAGLAGLAAAYTLSRARKRVVVVEKDTQVGGLSRTVVHRGFRFDLGGHRFFTKNPEIEELVRELLDGELVLTKRSSKIFMRGRYFDYPLRPLNALLGLGIWESAKIVLDYTRERLRSREEPVSLEDWVVANFGRELFNIFFKEYSEKVWGISCDRISAEWVAQRIRGLSLSVALRDALLKLNRRSRPPTLIREFLYPEMGIGRVAERLAEEVSPNPVLLGFNVFRIRHSGGRIMSITARNCDSEITVEADSYISSIPLPSLVRMLSPEPPEEVLRAAERLRFRDTIIVAVMVNRPRVTRLSWVYLPEKKVPFGRIHEPNNWSRAMSPPGKTSLVAEYFCFAGEKLWNMQEEELAQLTVEHLEALGFLGGDEVIDTRVVRVPNAYPLLEVGYRRHYETILDYLAGFENLQLVGRTGMFRYHNMDHAMETGIKAARNLLGERHNLLEVNCSAEYIEEAR
ncbi:MAG: NAD(P)-binding protein [Euryarchaeota archaeon]|nr:NAD(P)-binding protein [Euryarchaeota archaeon]